jgi:hypothetical protein
VASQIFRWTMANVGKISVDLIADIAGKWGVLA